MDEQDPTLVRNQPALTTARRRWWYTWTGLFALVVVGVLAWLVGLQPVIAWIGIAVTVALVVAMLIVGATVRRTRTRNRVFAFLLLAIAVVGLGSVCTIAALAWI